MRLTLLKIPTLLGFLIFTSCSKTKSSAILPKPKVSVFNTNFRGISYHDSFPSNSSYFSLSIDSANTMNYGQYGLLNRLTLKYGSKSGNMSILGSKIDFSSKEGTYKCGYYGSIEYGGAMYSGGYTTVRDTTSSFITIKKYSVDIATTEITGNFHFRLMYNNNPLNTDTINGDFRIVQ